MMAKPLLTGIQSRSLWDYMELEPAPLLNFIYVYGRVAMIDKIRVDGSDMDVGTLRHGSQWYDDHALDAEATANLFEQMGLPGSAGVLREHAARFRERAVIAVISAGCRTVFEALKGELATHLWVTTDQSGRRYLSTGYKEVFDKCCFPLFDSLAYDMNEAVLCYALDRNTACVMHLMRIVEGGLRKLGKSVGVQLNNRNGSPKSWQVVANELVHKANASNYKTSRARKRAQMRSLAVDRFNSLVRTRNACAHPDHNYDRNEALEFMVHIPPFVAQVARVISGPD
jgi:hypothetical protein